MEGGAKAEVGGEVGVRAGVSGKADVKMEAGCAKLGIRYGGGRGRGRLGRCVRGCILRCLNFPAKFVRGRCAAPGISCVSLPAPGMLADRRDRSAPQPARAVVPGSELSLRSGPG